MNVLFINSSITPPFRHESLDFAQFIHHATFSTLLIIGQMLYHTIYLPPFQMWPLYNLLKILHGLGIAQIFINSECIPWTGWQVFAPWK